MQHIEAGRGLGTQSGAADGEIHRRTSILTVPFSSEGFWALLAPEQ